MAILERWQNDEQWRNTMQNENGYDRDSIVGMDAMNAAPKASNDEIEEKLEQIIQRRKVQRL